MNSLEQFHANLVDPETASGNFEILSSPELRTEYIRLTDNIIYEMAEQKTDYAIFLDKSARPVAWMMKELWGQLAPQLPDGSTMPMPQIKFLNIDREQWGALLGRSEGEGIDARLLPEERVAELRTLFKSPGTDEKDNQTIFSHKNVMVVDEVRVSGDTLDMAGRILARAFPDVQNLYGCYWMDGQVKIDPKTSVKMNTKLPVWYSDRIVTGRLVGNRDSTKSSRSPSRIQQLGRYWLSTAFREEQDQKGLKLKSEIHQMAEELRDHELPYMPVALWDEKTDPIEKRIERINDITIEEYVGLRRQYPSIGSFVKAYQLLKHTS